MTVSSSGADRRRSPRSCRNACRARADARSYCCRAKQSRARGPMISTRSTSSLRSCAASSSRPRRINRSASVARVTSRRWRNDASPFASAMRRAVSPSRTRPTWHNTDPNAVQQCASVGTLAACSAGEAASTYRSHDRARVTSPHRSQAVSIPQSTTLATEGSAHSPLTIMVHASSMRAMPSRILPIDTSASPQSPSALHSSARSARSCAISSASCAADANAVASDTLAPINDSSTYPRSIHRPWSSRRRSARLNQPWPTAGSSSPSV